MLRPLVAIGVVAVLVLGSALAVHRRPWDPRLGEEETERALGAMVGGGARFECRPEQNDGTIELHDVDYFCERTDPRADFAYWVATDGERVTGTQFAG